MFRNKFLFSNYRNKCLKTIKKEIHYQERKELNASKQGINNYSAHSPNNISRGRTEELKSKLFYDSPTVPNRVPKYVFFITIILTMTTSFIESSKRHANNFDNEIEKREVSKIAPFVQAMEDLRFTANEQRQYMINKAIADKYSPGLFKHLRQRYYCEDIFYDEFIYQWRNTGAGGFIGLNTGVNYTSKRMESSYSDKGLFDNREIGYKS